MKPSDRDETVARIAAMVGVTGPEYRPVRAAIKNELSHEYAEGRAAAVAEIVAWLRGPYLTPFKLAERYPDCATINVAANLIEQNFSTPPPAAEAGQTSGDQDRGNALARVADDSLDTTTTPARGPEEAGTSSAVEAEKAEGRWYQGRRYICEVAGCAPTAGMARCVSCGGTAALHGREHPHPSPYMHCNGFEGTRGGR